MGEALEEGGRGRGGRGLGRGRGRGRGQGRGRGRVRGKGVNGSNPANHEDDPWSPEGREKNGGFDSLEHRVLRIFPMVNLHR